MILWWFQLGVRKFKDEIAGVGIKGFVSDHLKTKKI